MKLFFKLKGTLLAVVWDHARLRSALQRGQWLHELVFVLNPGHHHAFSSAHSLDA